MSSPKRLRFTLNSRDSDDDEDFDEFSAIENDIASSNENNKKESKETKTSSELDSDELNIRQTAFGRLLAFWAKKSKQDSFEWMKEIIPPGFDFNREFMCAQKHIYKRDEAEVLYTCPIKAAVQTQKPRTIYWMMSNGAKVDIPYADYGKDVRDAISDAQTQQRFTSIIAAGLMSSFLSSSPFSDFLVKGQCDPRILIQIMRLANSDSKYMNDRKRKC